MKKIVIIMGLLLLGALIYYVYGLKNSSNASTKGSASVVADEEVTAAPIMLKEVVLSRVESNESLDNEHQIKEDFAVKESIEEEIPLEDTEEFLAVDVIEENPEEQDAAVKEDLNEVALPDNIEQIIEEQEALIRAGVEAEPIAEEVEIQNQEKPVETIIPETEEEKIIREEDALIKSAIEAS